MVLIQPQGGEGNWLSSLEWMGLGSRCRDWSVGGLKIRVLVLVLLVLSTLPAKRQALTSRVQFQEPGNIIYIYICTCMYI